MAKELIAFAAVGMSVILLALAFVFSHIHHNKRLKTDYYAIFVMGFVWGIAGIPLQSFGISVLGFIFMAAGLAHRNQWKKDRKMWHRLDSSEKRFMLFAMSLIAILSFTCLILFLVTSSVASFY